MEQFYINDKGYITPCPYKETCKTSLLSDGVRPDGTTYTRGCSGKMWWCGNERDAEYESGKNKRKKKQI